MAVTRELAMQRQQWRDNRPDHPPRHKVDSEGFQTVRRRKHHLPGSPHGISVKIEAKTVEFKELSGLEEETLHIVERRFNLSKFAFIPQIGIPWLGRVLQDALENNNFSYLKWKIRRGTAKLEALILSNEKGSFLHISELLMMGGRLLFASQRATEALARHYSDTNFSGTSAILGLNVRPSLMLLPSQIYPYLKYSLLAPRIFQATKRTSDICKTATTETYIGRESMVQQQRNITALPAEGKPRNRESA